MVGEESLFQSSALRLSSDGFGAPVVLTNFDFRFIVTEQLASVGVDPSAILIEPEGRNTAPAILAAALFLQAQDDNAMMLVAPSDHVVPDAPAFRTAVRAGEPRAKAGDLVTFGIAPTHAETGYGYLELDGAPVEGEAVTLRRFVEKPNADAAQAMLEAVLVADKRRGQDLKLAVQALKDKGASQTTQFPRDHRPWGCFDSLAAGTRFQVKRIVVNPGAALSLQSHVHRAEHWIVVEGTAKVTINDDVQLVGENQSVYIPLGAVHRMENPGKVPMVLIEVQTGSYLCEDDIIRYENLYARD